MINLLDLISFIYHMQTEVESGELKTGSEMFQLKTVYKYVQFLILTDFKSPKTELT